MEVRIGVVDGSHLSRRSLLLSANPIRTTKIHRLSGAAMSSTVFPRSTRNVQRSGGIMSIHRISGQHSDSSTQVSKPSSVAHGFAINPLWMVTFAAGLLFGMLAVLLTSG
jgi:hypothetical protein